MTTLHGRNGLAAGVCLSALLCLAPRTIFAQTAPIPDVPTTVQLDPVQVNAPGADGLHLTTPSNAGSRLNLTPLETPASVQVLNGDTVRDRDQFTVNQALSRATGFSTIPTPGNGENGVSVRGFTGVGSVTQLLDGTQLYVGSGTTTFPFDTWSAQRIEILTGPASVLYGTGAVGGTVNVVSRAPDPAGYHSEVRLLAGSFGTFGEQLDTTGPAGPYASYRLDVSNFGSKGYVDRGGNGSTAVSASVRFDPAPNLHIIVSDDYGQQTPMNYLGTPLVNGQLLRSERTKNYDANNGKVHYTDNFLQARTFWDPTDSIAVHNNAYLLTDQRLFREIDYYAYQPKTGQLQVSDHREVYHHETQYGDHGDVSVTGRLFGLKNQILGGFDVNQVEFTLAFDSPYTGTQTVALGNDATPNFTHVVPTTPSYRTYTTQGAGYAEDRLSLLDNLTIVGGVRTDAYHVVRNDLLAITSTRNNLTSTGWHVGTVYKPIPGLALYAQYAVATDPVNNVISLTPAQQAFALTTGRQEEVGIKQVLWDGRLAYTFAGYHIVKNNLLVPDPTNINVTEQVGQQSSAGLELSVAANLGHGVGLEANGTVLRARYDSFSETIAGKAVSRNGNTPPNVPTRLANAFLTWNFAENWQVRADAQYVGKRYADNANLIQIPAYYLFGGGLRWRPIERLRVDFQVQNALNKTYAVAPYNGGTQFFLGAPLSALGSVSVSF
jgi:iron complex outermembrane receptor protein